MMHRGLTVLILALFLIVGSIPVSCGGSDIIPDKMLRRIIKEALDEVGIKRITAVACPHKGYHFLC
jgi:hypothetical protein